MLKITYPGAAEFLPRPGTGIDAHRRACHDCKGCDLYKRATPAVFGEGPTIPDRKAKSTASPIMLIGEQPGDQEDQEGHPFVGSAGKLLDKALADAGIDRSTVYVTNAVKHFKWEPAPRGKRRIHSKPTMAQVNACRSWLKREIEIVRPKVIVLLGTTAGQSLLGGTYRIGTHRGTPISGTEWASTLIATIHPSAILRQREAADRAREFAALVEDLKIALH